MSEFDSHRRLYMVEIHDNVDFLPPEIEETGDIICYGAIKEDCFTPFDIEKHVILDGCHLSGFEYVFVVYKKFLLYTPDGPLTKWKRIL